MVYRDRWIYHVYTWYIHEYTTDIGQVPISYVYTMYIHKIGIPDDSLVTRRQEAQSCERARLPHWRQRHCRTRQCWSNINGPDGKRIALPPVFLSSLSVLCSLFSQLSVWPSLCLEKYKNCVPFDKTLHMKSWKDARMLVWSEVCP